MASWHRRLGRIGSQFEQAIDLGQSGAMLPVFTVCQVGRVCRITGTFACGLHVVPDVVLDVVVEQTGVMGAMDQNMARGTESATWKENWVAVPVFDSSKIDELRSFQPPHLPSLIPQIIQRFVSELEIRGEVIAAAVRGGDVVTLQGHAHSLKSSSAMLGAMRVSAICERIEQSGSAGAAEQVVALSARLLIELRAAVESLRAASV